MDLLDKPSAFYKPRGNRQMRIGGYSPDGRWWQSDARQRNLRRPRSCSPPLSTVRIVIQNGAGLAQFLRDVLTKLDRDVGGRIEFHRSCSLPDGTLEDELVLSGRIGA